MKLSADEDVFLRHWMYDEMHYQDGRGPAKQLQLQHRAVPNDLATLIAAAIPDPAEQAAAGQGPPPRTAPTWPWGEDTLLRRVREARELLAPQKQPAETAKAHRERELPSSFS
jgi:hypothetical protein